MTREELAARFVSAQIVAAPSWAIANCNPGTTTEFIDSALKIADEFLAYAAKQREKAAGECKHEWRQPLYMSDHICHKCGAPKVKPEPPKPERVARDFFPVGTRVMVFDRYRLALPCCGEVIKTDGVTQGCIVRLDANSHGRAAERYPDGIYVFFEQLREILPEEGK